MGKKLFVSNIDFEVKEEELREMFTAVGACVSVVMAVDRETRRPKGFAFVEMETAEDAERAVKELNNKVINGRAMKVADDRGKGGGSEGSEGRDGNRRPEPLPPMQRLSLFRRRRKMDPFLEDPTKSIDYKDVATLSRFISERGKILSRRLTGLSAYNQRRIASAIKRAQQAGLMPFTTVQTN